MSPAKVGFDDWVVQTEATAAEADGLPRTEAWPRLAPEALYGLPGRVVETVSPYTEADPVAILTTFLTAAGNLLGPGPMRAPAMMTIHAGCSRPLWKSGRGRKGTSLGAPLAVLHDVDPEWATRRIASGLSTGEGLIYHVRDPFEKRQPIKEKGRVVAYESVIEDHGESDKRLLVVEPEMAAVLKRMERESSSLSAVIRQAWDTGTLATLTKNSPLRATGAHICIVAHITAEELQVNLAETERANGFANRFLFFLVRRSKELPEAPPVPEARLRPLVEAMREVLQFRPDVPLVRDDAARAIWADLYHDLSQGKPGMFGAIVARAEAQVLRLSALHAVLDCSPAIRPQHLGAALALWTYAEQSARLIFGTRLGDPIVDRIEAALRARGRLSRDQIRDIFSRHVPAERIAAALAFLESRGRARKRTEETGGRPVEIWEAAP
jgi:hypothetical protein